MSATVSQPHEPRGEKPGGRWRRKTDPLTQLVLTVPVFLIYHLGILFLDRRNGVDLVSTLFWRLQNASIAAYVGVTLLFAVVLLVAGGMLRKKHHVSFRALGPLLLESVFLAIGLSVSIGWVVSQVAMSTAAPSLQAGGQALNPLAAIVLSCGAGFHEELVFRVLLFGGMLALGKLVSERRLLRMLVALVVSSLLFSAVHYVGSLADDFTFLSFFFRFLAGVYLALVYRFRGFAVAVYTHTLYDVFVFLIWS